MKRLPVVLLYLWLPALISSGPVAQAPTPQPPTTQPPITVAPAPPPGAPLLVMTFNIRYGTAADGENHWFKRRETLFALLREQQADVIGLQEALHHQVEEILAAVPGYAYVGVGRTDGRRAGEYAAILYRTARLQARRSDTFWFSETPGVVRSATLRRDNSASIWRSCSPRALTRSETEASHFSPKASSSTALWFWTSAIR